MKTYRVTIRNGAYPLTYDTLSIAKAYGCLMEARNWACHVDFDPEELMEVLADLRAGRKMSCETGGWRVEVLEMEESQCRE